ncbi:MAG TPA: hypothetical protein VKG24_04135 [Pseudolabrys sp.]|nr:hypothetical protein [Pseudolabrys sp.]
MSRTRKRRGHTERFVALKYWLLQSQAWRSLPGNTRALYIELAQGYNGSNNGRIPYSAREAIAALHVSKSTAARLLKILEDRGFIVCTKRGAFSLKTTKDASEWRLTEYDSDVPVAHATKDFMRWRPPEDVDITTLNRQTSHHRKSRTRVPQRNRTGTPVGPYGYPSETVKPKEGRNGYPSETVKAKNDPPTGTPMGHLQLPGAKCADEGGERSAPEGSAVASEPPSRKTDRERTPREKLQARQQAENQIADLIGWSCVQEMPPELVEGLCGRWPNIDRAELFELKQKYEPPAAVGGQRARVGAA